MEPATGALPLHAPEVFSDPMGLASLNPIPKITSYFREEDHALNLAVARICLMCGLLYMSLEPTNDAVWFSTMPPALRVPPIGYGPLLPWIPFDTGVVTVTRFAFWAACALAIIGFQTRIATVLAAVLSVYVLGLPQLFGKINHFHHLVWFAAVLAASRCGDALSVDAWLRRRRGQSAPISPSRAYGLPLRIIWVLLGIVYFFPGFWKLIGSGLAWAFSENLRWQFYAKWLELGGFLPLFRIDEVPWLYKLGGLYTLVFELSFLPAVFFARLRPVLFVAGIVFHGNTMLFLHIGFIVLLICYPVLIDWQWCLDKLRIRRAAAARHGEVPAGETRALRIVGGVLIGAGLICGFGPIDSWPFGIYPRFSGTPEPVRVQLGVDLLDGDGNRMPFDVKAFSERFHTARWYKVLGRVGNMPAGPESDALQHALLELIRTNDPAMASAQSARFYKESLALEPWKWAQNPIAREPLNE